MPGYEPQLVELRVRSRRPRSRGYMSGPATGMTRQTEPARNSTCRPVYSKLSAEEQRAIGLWSESFSTLTSRLETNYTGLDYLPGTKTEPSHHDSLPGRRARRHPAHDLFATESNEPQPHPAESTGRRLLGTNYNYSGAMRHARWNEKLDLWLRNGDDYCGLSRARTCSTRQRGVATFGS